MGRLMGRIFDSATLMDGDARVVSSEVVIVGTGPAGAFAAMKILEHGHSVLMVECGGKLPDVDASRYFLFENHGKENPVVFGVNWQLGGASTLWSGRCAPLEQTDVSASKGWPLEYSEIEPYYDEAAKILGLLPIRDLEGTDIEMASGDRWRKMLFSGRFSIKKFQWNVPPFNTGAYLQRAVAQNKNLNVVTNLRLLSFDHQRDDSRMASAMFATTNGRRFHISDKIFVIAVGGIETPRVLLNSCGGEGLGNSSGTVGRFFSTHPKGHFGTIILNRSVSLKSPLFSDTTSGRVNLRFGIGLPQAHDGFSPLNHYVQLTGTFENVGPYLLEQARFVVRDVSNRQGITQFRGANQWVKRLAIAFDRSLFHVLGKAGIWRGRASVLSVRAFFDQYPNPECRVGVTSELDSFGMPKARVFWNFSEKDTISIRHFAEEFKTIFREFDVGEFYPALGRDPKDWHFTAVHSHFLGTTRMGTDPGTSVADSFGRLHDVSNVYVCGPSLFPSYGHANPFLSIAAFSLRTGARIVAELRERPYGD